MKKIFYVKLMSLIFLLYNCENQNNIENDKNTYIKTAFTNNQQKFSGSKLLTFDTFNQSLDTDAQAESEFDNTINGWSSNLCDVEIYSTSPEIKGRLKFDLPADYGNGMKASIDVANKDYYNLYFDVKFNSGFDFSRGGKVGFGFSVGSGVTGCNYLDATTNNLGGSFRVVWYDKFDGNGPYLFPYIYHKDMPGTCGNELIYTNKYYITDNQNYRIKLTIGSNSSATNFDGYGKMEVSTDYGQNYTTVWENSTMRWSGSASDWQRKITNIYFSTFRGGSGTIWNGSQGTESIYFDNLRWW